MYAPRRITTRACGAALVLGAVAALGLSAAVQAQAGPPGWPPGPPGPPAFSALDLNGDGQVSRDEFDQHRAQRMAARAAQGRLMRNAANAPRFEAWDTDANGYLTPAELTAGQQARLAARGPGGGPGYGPGPGGGMARPCWRNP